MKFKIVFTLALVLAGITTTVAQNNMTAQEVALKIATRIVNTTSYLFENKKTGKTYTTVKDLALSPDIQVQSKYTQWH